MMLFGLGGWATLPAVIGGYIGNPFRPQPWIETAMIQGVRENRFPQSAVIFDDDDDTATNAFTSLPIVGGWGRRPLELATLRLMNMIGVSFENWDELKPTDIKLTRATM